jgi:hypothetical protein
MWNTSQFSGAPNDARSFMDGSGWTVSTGRDTRATGGARTDSGSPFSDTPVMQAGAGAGGAGAFDPMLIAGVAAVLLVLFLVKKRKG